MGSDAIRDRIAGEEDDIDAPGAGKDGPPARTPSERRARHARRRKGSNQEARIAEVERRSREAGRRRDRGERRRGERSGRGPECPRSHLRPNRRACVQAAAHLARPVPPGHTLGTGSRIVGSSGRTGATATARNSIGGFASRPSWQPPWPAWRARSSSLPRAESRNSSRCVASRPSGLHRSQPRPTSKPRPSPAASPRSPSRQAGGIEGNDEDCPF